MGNLSRPDAPVKSPPAGAPHKPIEVLAIKPLSNAGSLRAFVTVKLGGILIHDVRIVQQFGQKAWVALPQKEFVNKAGKKTYLPVVELNDRLKQAVCDAVLAAWQREG